MSAPAAAPAVEKKEDPISDSVPSAPSSSTHPAPLDSAQVDPANATSSPPPNEIASASYILPPTYDDVASSRNRGDNGPGSGGIKQAPPNGVGPDSKNPNAYPMHQYHGPVMVTPLHMLTETPAMIDCPWCNRQAVTTTQREGTPMQFVAGALLCLVCVCLACLPCIAGWCEEVNISCSACRKRVATLPDSGGPIQLHLPPHMVQVPSQYQSHPPPQQANGQVPSQYPTQPPPAHVQGQAPPQQPSSPGQHQPMQDQQSAEQGQQTQVPSQHQTNP